MLCLQPQTPLIATLPTPARARHESRVMRQIDRSIAVLPKSAAEEHPAGLAAIVSTKTVEC